VTPATPDAAAALARLYDLDLLDDPGDLDLYRALATRVGGPVLELAAGTGRLAVPLAEAGYTVTAVDRDAAMLSRARATADAAGPEVARRLRTCEADVRGLSLPDAGTFRLAFIALNSLFLMGGRAEQATAVATLAAHLAHGGLAVVDAWLPDAEDLGRFDGRLMLEWMRLDPETGHLVTKTGSALHDAATSTVRLTAIFEEGRQGEAPIRWHREDTLRLTSADELRAFAEAAGLVVEQVAGDYDLGSLAPGSERAILVARKGSKG
jgi:SAM-dependent methyltransferase